MDTSTNTVPTQQAPDATRPRSARQRLPFAVYLLGAVTFLTGTTELILAGLLPDVARSLHTTVSGAGVLVTVFAIGNMLGAPIMTLLTLRVPRRSTLTITLIGFAVGHVMVAMSTDLTVVLIGRLIAAVAVGTFWALGALVAADLAGPQNSARALGIMVAGTTLANIVGIPAGTFMGQILGWQGPFWVLAALAVLAAVALLLWLPKTQPSPDASVTAELASLRHGRLWLIYLGIALVQGGLLTTYTYVAPLLTDRAGLPEATIPLVMLGFGVGALVGTTLGGRLGDQHPYRVIVPAAILELLVLVALVFTGNLAAAAITLIVLLGFFGLAIPPILVSQAIQVAGPVNSLAVSVSTSAFQVGVAIGSSVGGAALASSLAEQGPAVASTVIAVLAVAVFAILAVTRTRTAPQH